MLLQRLAGADTFLKQGKVDMGRAGYRTVIGQARERHVPAVEGTAMLRIAMLDAALAGLPATVLHPSGRYGSNEANYREAKKSVAAILATTDPALTGFRDAARLIGARLQAHRGDMSGIEAIAADYARDKPSQPILLYAPVMNDTGTFFDPDRAGLPLLGEQDFVAQWVDVTFVIDGDGRVSDVEVLRQSPALRNDWVDPVLKTVARRRYAPVAVPVNLSGVRRVERYTMTAYWGEATGTNTRVRTGTPRLEMLDLTADPGRTASSAPVSATPAPGA